MTNKLKLISLTAIILVATVACNKTAIEEVRFPKRVELLVGQYCLPQVVLEEDEKVHTFSDWITSDQNIVAIKGDTLSALAKGECDVTASFRDNLGDHTATCSVVVKDLEIPKAEDTIFIRAGETIELCKFDVPGVYTINYELQYGNGYVYSSRLDYYSNSPTIPTRPSPLILSPLYTYYKNTIVPESDIISLRLFCTVLGIDVTIPIVTLP